METPNKTEPIWSLQEGVLIGEQKKRWSHYMTVHIPTVWYLRPFWLVYNVWLYLRHGKMYF